MCRSFIHFVPNVQREKGDEALDVVRLGTISCSESRHFHEYQKQCLLGSIDKRALIDVDEPVID